MLQVKTCEAIVEFRLNSPDQKDGILVRAGDQFLFDGRVAKVTDQFGIDAAVVAPQLRNLEGEWFEEIATESAATPKVSESPVESSKADESSVLEEFKKVQKAEAQGGSSVKPNESVEESQPGGDGSPQNLGKMVADYEKKTSKGSIILDDDAKIVKETTPVDEASKGNKPGVVAKEANTDKKRVVTEDQRLAKKTNYEKIESSEPKVRKKPEIISDAEGEVVKKTSNPAIYKNEMRDRDSKLNSKPKRFRENEVVKEATYEDEDKETDVGSSTQTKKTNTKKTSGKKGSTKKAAKDRRTVETLDDQEGTIVAKTRKVNSTKETADGILLESKVGGSSEMSVPEATTSANDQIDIGEAKVGRASEMPVDIGEDVDIGELLNDV